MYIKLQKRGTQLCARILLKPTPEKRLMGRTQGDKRETWAGEKKETRLKRSVAHELQAPALSRKKKKRSEENYDVESHVENDLI